jgi:lipoprotein-anchoring transpeptidase ErfK/SrfK
MRQSWRATLVIVTLLACIAMLAALALPTVAAASSGTDTPTSPVAAASTGTADPGLTLSAKPPLIKFGTKLTLTGRLDVPGAILTLSRRTSADAGFVPMQTLTADPAGSIGPIVLVPKVSATYRLDYAGDSTWAPAYAEVSVGVTPRLSLKATYRKPLFIGDRVTFQLAVSPARPGAVVELRRREGDAWVRFKSVTLDANSRATARWAADPAMRVAVRAFLAADADFSETSSEKISMFVNPANAHRVPCRFPQYIVIVVHEYKLYYYEQGVMKRSFNVVLGRPGFPTPIGTFHIYTKRKPGGVPALGACAMFYRHKGGIAIHGTDQPYLLNNPLPRNYSHGCARMYNAQALWLFARCPVGTTVHNLR